MNCPICNANENFSAEEDIKPNVRFRCDSIFLVRSGEPREEVYRSPQCIALCDTCGHALPHHITQCAANLRRERLVEIHRSPLYQSLAAKLKAYDGQALHDRNLINRLCNRIGALEDRIKSLQRQLEPDDK